MFLRKSSFCPIHRFIKGTLSLYSMRERQGNRRKPAGRFGSDSGADRPRRRFSRDSGESSGRFGDRPERRFNRDDRRPGRLEMHQVVCDSCGKECEVPFRPTSSKPVYCSDCFRKQDGSSRSRGSSDNSSRELEMINQKLDRIMNALKIR